MYAVFYVEYKLANNDYIYIITMITFNLLW